jgi:hypothetical protein
MTNATSDALGPFSLRMGLRLITTVCGIAVASAAFAQQEKPNVVLMLSDKLGYRDIGAFQGGAIRETATSALCAKLNLGDER